MGKEWRKDDAAYTKVRTDENLMETLRHGNSDFPFQFYDEDLEDFDFGCVDWHWHAEFEFVFVQKGEVHFSVGEDRFHLPEGSGLFINTKVLHRFFTKKEGVIPNFVFGPGLLAPKESLIYRKYVLPVMDFFPDSLAFLPDQPRQERILLEMKKIISLCRLGQSSELRLSSMIQRLWDLLWEEGSSVSRDVKREAHSAASQARLQLMMQYIHAHYEEPVALEDIASCAAISKSSALGLFKKYLHTTPVKYLIDYRMKEAAKLLSATESSVSAIARQTGFDNTGYFCRTFKELYGLTPTEYRRRL